ncbi:aminotransferase class I/II-fold pyridoxal phosphate-dependent enzyme [Stackebrandtia nassauensis]|uniref:Transcriptional regulator, GntR family with aminotransferase domain protein n=1 Tax=Stackebrandtia nassauensis (strain DSM 44728 / CIP 108903 / NRRL B-16338 / NBRC 102104 / LLR-40K-21) TaxID=446470 RepID=D3Q2A3_STANL|nr:aminotransferase class I/II-fold pyridoxal phosphate-dependent enzyme [Stackebrandtia nassauensis]ADD43836.1 transcriptional regulator, GntR family with aminotransferase domain protein [Stackebrandtia nassauensis DSM 44728]
MVEQYQITGAGAAEIVASVETGVRTSRLAPGSALPPVRALAAELGLATATVAAAYRTLRQRGIVDTAGRHGTRVRQRPAIEHRGRTALPAGVLDLTTGEPDPALLPDLAVALRQVPTTPASYRDAGASPRLLAAARQRLAADGLSGTPTVTGGALDGIYRALSAHLRPGDRVAVEDPCWSNVRDLLASLGMHAVPVAVDDEGPTPEALEQALRSGASACVLTSRAHNPTGAVITAERARRLRAVLARHPGVLAIEDDHWAELSDDPLHPVADAAARWLFLRSVSKPYGPDLRLAIGCGDEATVARLHGQLRLSSGWVSTVLQHLVLGVWDDPLTTPALHRARDTYRDRRQALLTALAAHGVTARGHTGLNVWIPVPDETAAVTTLRDAGYAVAPGTPYRIASASGIRVSTSDLPLDHVEPLATVIAEAMHTPYPLA